MIAALRADDRNDLVGAFYTEWTARAPRRHRAGEHPGGPGSEAVGAGKWMGAADDESWDAEVERSTKEGRLAGDDVGSPVLAFGSPAVGAFGPIVSPPPQGDDAITLLHQVIGAIAGPAFYELKRNRTDEPQFGPRP